MNKTYITPEALSISLDPKMPLLLGYSRAMGEEGVFTKGYASSNVSDEGDSDNTTTTTTGVITNIWDQEW